MALQNIRTDALGNATIIDLDTAASGSITAAAQAVTLNLSGDSAYALEVQGTFVGTLQIERTVDGTTWRPVNGALTGVGTLVQALTAPGSLQGHSGPSLAIRLIATAWTSGTATVMLRAGVGSGAVFMVAPLPAGGNVIGTVGVNNFPATQAVSIATNTPDVTDRAARALGVTTIGAGAATIGTVNPPAIVKGTQGTVGVTTQDLKDAGRNAVHFYTVIPVLTTAGDVLQSLTGTKGGVTVVATVTPAVVTAGKTFRVTRLAATYIATAVSGYAVIRFRFNTAGVVAVTSPIAATLAVGSGAPTTANATDTEEASLAEGWEFAAGTGVGISVTGFAAVTATAVGYVLVSVTGFEY